MRKRFFPLSHGINASGGFFSPKTTVTIRKQANLVGKSLQAEKTSRTLSRTVLARSEAQSA
jgi:hypothetical protein